LAFPRRILPRHRRHRRADRERRPLAAVRAGGGAGIDLDPREIIATRHTEDGRFVIFSSAGVTAGWPLRHGLLVRLDAMVACDGWTVQQLLGVVQARLAAEKARSAHAAAGVALAFLDSALAVYKSVSASASPAVSFELGDPASPYQPSVSGAARQHHPAVIDGRIDDTDRNAIRQCCILAWRKRQYAADGGRPLKEKLLRRGAAARR
jgi:hypothetical protein